MVHYVNGKLVVDDARKNAIHVHKNCTEWYDIWNNLLTDLVCIDNNI